MCVDCFVFHYKDWIPDLEHLRVQRRAHRRDNRLWMGQRHGVASRGVHHRRHQIHRLIPVIQDFCNFPSGTNKGISYLILRSR